MIITLDSHGGVPLYRQVIDQVRRQIMTGVLAAGDQLESVKNLSSRLKVNPMTISKAYGYLVQEGLVERRRGVGLFVGAIGGEQGRRAKRSLLADALREAAALAVQLEVPDAEASRLFAEHLARYRAQKGAKTE